MQMPPNLPLSSQVPSVFLLCRLRFQVALVTFLWPLLPRHSSFEHLSLVSLFTSSPPNPTVIFKMDGAQMNVNAGQQYQANRESISVPFPLFE